MKYPYIFKKVPNANALFLMAQKGLSSTHILVKYRN